MNTMAAVKSAPRWNNDLASALAAYEHEELAMPRSELRVRAAGPCRPMTRCIWPRDTKACTAPDSAKPSTSAHSVSQNMKNASRRLSPIVTSTPMPSSIPPGGMGARGAPAVTAGMLRP
jgi:hypothetical protein